MMRESRQMINQTKECSLFSQAHADASMVVICKDYLLTTSKRGTGKGCSFQYIFIPRQSRIHNYLHSITQINRVEVSADP